MPRLGCNYSLPLLRLLAAGAVAVDWIKLSRRDTVDEDLAAARAVRPVLLHTVPRAGLRPEAWGAYDWATLRRQLRAAGSPHVGLHLDLQAEDWDRPLDLDGHEREQAAAALARLASGVRTVQAQVGVPVLVENMPHYGGEKPTWHRPRTVVAPEAFWQVSDETGAGLLLDAGHLRCVAYQLGVDVRAYARALPLGAVREIHVAGPRIVPASGMHDRHWAMQEEDYSLLAWLLERTEPAIVTLEYGGTGEAFETAERNDPKTLEAQLRRLSHMLTRSTWGSP